MADKQGKIKEILDRECYKREASLQASRRHSDCGYSLTQHGKTVAGESSWCWRCHANDALSAEIAEIKE